MHTHLQKIVGLSVCLLFAYAWLFVASEARGRWQTDLRQPTAEQYMKARMGQALHFSSALIQAHPILSPTRPPSTTWTLRPTADYFVGGFLACPCLYMHCFHFMWVDCPQPRRLCNRGHQRKPHGHDGTVTLTAAAAGWLASVLVHGAADIGGVDTASMLTSTRGLAVVQRRPVRQRHGRKQLLKGSHSMATPSVQE